MGRLTKLDIIRPTLINYRKEDDYFSYSKLSTFLKDKVKYYKKFVLKDNSIDDDDETKELQFGTMVDLFITNEEDFDNKFAILKELPSPQMSKFCNLVYKNMKNYKEFSEVLKQSYEDLKDWNGGKLKSGFKNFIENFDTDVPQEYFKNILDEKIITDEVSRSKAYNIAKKVKSIKQFAPKSESSEIYRKFQIVFKLGEDKFGAEIDEFEVCHEEKKIYLYDYKTSSFLDNFIFMGFLKFNYYLQSSLYKFGLIEWAKNNLPGYTVENMAFKVMDSNNYMEPLLFKTNDWHYESGFTGFFVGKKYYKGIIEIIEEIKESQKENIWRMSIENYKNKGIVNIPNFSKE